MSSWGRPTGFFLGSHPWRPSWFRRVWGWLAGDRRLRARIHTLEADNAALRDLNNRLAGQVRRLRSRG